MKNTDKTELAPAPAPADPITAMLADAEKLAALDVDKLREMLAMQERLQAGQAKREFNAAFNTVQARMTPVRRVARNKHTASMYARAEDVDKMIDPLLSECGFSVSFSTGKSELPDHILIVMTVRHVGGHDERHTLDAPIDERGIKGNATKTKIHGMASSLTYCKRHLKCSVFDVQLTDDDDGNRAGNVGPSADGLDSEQIATLHALMDELGGRLSSADLSAYLQQVYGVSRVDDLPRGAYDNVVRKLAAKRGETV